MFRVAGKGKRQRRKNKQINQDAIQEAQKLTKKQRKNIMAKDNDNNDINENIDNQPKEQTISQKINALDALVEPALDQIQEQINSANVTTEDQKENLKVLAGVLLQTQEHIQTLNAIPDPSGLLNDELNTQYNQLVTNCGMYKEQNNLKNLNLKKEIDDLIKFRNEDYTKSLQKTALELRNRYASVISLDNFSEDQKKAAKGMLDKLEESFDIKGEDALYNNIEELEKCLADDFAKQVENLCTANDELKKAKSAEQRYPALKRLLDAGTVLYETTKAFGKTGAALTKNLAGLVKDCITYTVREFAINPTKAFANDVYSGVTGGVDITLAKEEYAHWKGDGKIAAAKAGKIARLVVANFIPVAIGGGVGLAAGTVTGTAKATWGATKGLAYAPVASFKDLKDRAVAIKDEGFSSAKIAGKNIKEKPSYAENIRKEKLKKKFTIAQRRT